MTDLRPSLDNTLRSFSSAPLRQASLDLLKTLGYSSDRSLELDGSPEAFLESFSREGLNFNPEKALVKEWAKIELLFQLTGEDLSGQSDLFNENEVKQGNLRSYLFFALELKGENYARGTLSTIARQINRLFPMPVMLLIKHNCNLGISACNAPKGPSSHLSIAVINRRPNKKDADKDVLGKVTLIRNIALRAPHRGHLDILADMALPTLEKTRKSRIDSFDALHAAWEEVFNVDLLNQKFYRELSSWYFWALQNVHFPHDELDHQLKKDDLFADKEKLREHDAKNLIRLLTRLLFVWFVKEKDLVPQSLFDRTDVAEKWLKDFDPESMQTSYYKAILQNLFFATLNQSQGKREFRKSGRQHRNITNLMRYEDSFQDPQAFVEVVEAVVPFMNGGLFECLDKPHPTLKGLQGGDVILYEDGFSDREDNILSVPDFLFFGKEQTTDLSDVLGDKKRGKEKVRGIISILNRYKFTIVENTPIDQEIALDPELLGKVFENLLASYNPETKTTARKQTGSFYTPRSIVEYMVDESIKAYLRKELCKSCEGVSQEDAKEGLEILFAYTEQEHAFSEEERMALIKAIDACKILDPACGSGAFPMGILHKLEFILGKLDKNNQLWRDRQLQKVDATITAAEQIEDGTIRESTLSDLEDQKVDIQEAFDNNALGYGRKLYLIENCIYGVDIQSIATQVSKLRFFISLIVDQKVDAAVENFGIRPLPNLETKFVTADTLIHIEKPAEQRDLFENETVKEWERDLKKVRHNLFGAKTPKTKRKYREQDKEIRERIANALAKNGWSNRSAKQLADWDPYDQNASCPFFDPEWMFDLKGFDVVIGNPPYGARISKKLKSQVKEVYPNQNYQLDTYLLFIERGIQLLSLGGVQSLIIPNTWLPGIMFTEIRKFVFSQTTVASLVDVKSSVFKAVVNNIILIHNHQLPKENSVLVLDYADECFIRSYEQPQEIWDSPNGKAISIALTPELQNIASRIEHYDTLDRWFLATPGCKPYQRGKGKPKQTSEIVKEKPFTSTQRKCELFRPLLRGKLIQKYQILWNENLWIKFGEWLAEPRVSAGYDAPVKIVLRQTGDSLIAALDKQKFVVMNNMFTVVPKVEGATVYFVYCALNSSTLNWYYQNCINPEKGEALAEVKKGHLIRLPIAHVTPKIEQGFKQLVHMIQKAKKQDLRVEAAFLEDLIDACVLESYFPEEAATKKLLFIDQTLSLLAGHSDTDNLDEIQSFIKTINAPAHPIRNQLLRLTTESPDLFGVIKQEGRV